MFVGYLVSRAALSISMMVFGLNALIDVGPRKWLKEKWCMLGFGVVALYAVTYFWSSDLHYWNVHVVMKTPILLLPLSFAFLPRFSIKQYQVFTVAIALMLLGGIAYSLSFFIGNTEFYANAYKSAQVLPTPGKDYVRFSLAIALFVIWCLYVWPRLESNFVKWLTAVAVVVMVVYLHILASKTGLIAIYFFFVSLGVYYAILKRRTLGIILLCLIIGSFLFAYKYIPTFHERLGYISYTYYVFQNGGRLDGQYGDIERLVSYDIAIRLIKEHPYRGVGVGSMFNEMVAGYERWYPGLQDETTLIPHNQFLTVAMGCGIPAMIFFAIWVFIPFGYVRKNRDGFFFLVILLILLLQLMIEPVLEIQFGVFVYLFFLLWQRHTLSVREVSDTWFPKNRKAIAA